MLSTEKGEAVNEGDLGEGNHQEFDFGYIEFKMSIAYANDDA